MEMQTELFWIVPLALLGFVGFWSVIVGLISLFGGWQRLARQYRDLDNYQGRKLRMRSGRLGASDYNGVLILGADFIGMYLAVSPLFRIGHPPLFIPWNDIQTGEEQRLFTTYSTLSFAKVPRVKLMLPSRVMEEVQALKTGNLI